MKSKRLLIDSMIAVMLVGLLAGLFLHEHQKQDERQRYEQLHRALALLGQQARYHGALGEVSTNRYGFPYVISPTWFASMGLPTNPFVPGRYPWLDVAPAGDMVDHPPDPVITSANQAGFWYNPNRGIIRARVRDQFSETQTLALYNQLNNSQLTRLPISPDAARAPLPLPLDRLALGVNRESTGISVMGEYHQMPSAPGQTVTVVEILPDGREASDAAEGVTPRYLGPPPGEDDNETPVKKPPTRTLNDLRQKP